MNKQEIINLFKVMLKAFDSLDETELDQILKGKGRLEFIDIETRNVQKRGKSTALPKTRLTTEELQSLVIQLQSSTTREEAAGLLHKDNYALLKESLAKLAQLLGIHVDKSDRRDTLETKIVEFVVGAKLRSAAIKSLNLKHS